MNLSSIRPGDVVLVDGPAAKGGDPAHAVRRFYAEVRDVRPAAGGGELTVRRSAVEATFEVRARLVLEHFRKAGRPRNRPRSIERQAEGALA